MFKTPQHLGKAGPIPPKENRTEGTRQDSLIMTTLLLPACPHIFSSTKAERKTQSQSQLRRETQMPSWVLDELEPHKE